MRIIFSRKGFDSAAGKAPSPIINGRPFSLPIPTSWRSETTYEILGLGEIVENASNGRIARNKLCHEDPMFSGKRCAFGQTGSAQSHLRNQGVAIGDVFLFFGLFSDEITNEKHHRVFGYQKVEKIHELGTHPTEDDQPVGFPSRHPHTLGEWNNNNTLYLGEGATCMTASKELRLTQDGGPISTWKIPHWLFKTGLSFHGKKERWIAPDTLNLVARGQEFVCDIGTSHEPATWLDKMILEIRG